ncbi:MAG: 6-bladed beta-propeller [Gemmatimonadetes bacterium]|nr:6-bladed beta-propeller [Gemmatimonadota bacterium]MYB98700.1 6-bladed beta-propeller [Gemmatimonadota bacterium]
MHRDLPPGGLIVMSTPTFRNSPPTPHSCRADADPTRREWSAALRTATFIRGCFPAAASLSLACGPIADSPDATDTVVETETIGDTTVVRTVSGSVWRGDATLVPETSVGELDGPEEYLFGSIGAIAVDDDHNVYVLDEQARHVRVFDAAGTYLATLGRGGKGPGEFDVPVGIAISDSRVLVRDPANARVQLFHLGTWEAEEWRYGPSNIFMNTPLYTDDRGRVYVDISTNEEVRFIVMGSDGTHLDTIPAPDAPDGFDGGKCSMNVRGESGDYWVSVSATVPFCPDWDWTVHSSGHFLSALSTAYRIHLGRDEDVLRIERVHTPVAVSDFEREHHRQRILDRMRRVDAGWSWDGPPIPDHKPPFRGLAAGTDGRIWVRLWTETQQVANEEHDPANPESVAFTLVEPIRYDVFEADGTYLGAMVPPEGFRPSPSPVFGRSFVWAVERDELDVERVVRYRIALPAS